MNTIQHSTRWLGLAIVMLAGSKALPAQTYQVLHSFGELTNKTGFGPQAPLAQGLDGTLYGVNNWGEGEMHGVVFKLQPDGTGFTALEYFTNHLEGEGPGFGLVLSGTTLYGTTQSGGSFGHGTVYKLDTDGSGFTVLKHFTGGNVGLPGGPTARLVLEGTTLYGVTCWGGTYDNGTVFKVNTDGSGFAVLKYFSGGDGRGPSSRLVLEGTTLYGTTCWGGTYDKGTVFKVSTDGSGFAVLKHFAGSTDGDWPRGLALSGATVYGTTYHGGSYGEGMVYRLNTDGSGFGVLKHFTGGTDGNMPEPSLLLSGTTLYGTTRSGGSATNGVVYKVNTSGSGFAVLKSFTGNDGSGIPGTLLLSGSTLYGTREYGGSGGGGTVYKLNTDGSGFAVIQYFSGSHGAKSPVAGLVMSGGALYGTTSTGGTPEKGTVFKCNADGADFTVLKEFSGGSDGNKPRAGLVDSGTALFGATEAGGDFGDGTVFKINNDGSGFAVLKHFTISEGKAPGSRLLLSEATLYGTTIGGGVNGEGTVFKLDTDGNNFTVLKHLGGSQGTDPQAGLVLSGNTLYGVASRGGFAEDAGTVFKLNTDGSGFTVLYRFTGGDGACPQGGLVLSGGTLIGTTSGGGSAGWGTIFQINTNGSGFTLLKEFTNESEGKNPIAGLLLSGSTLYGTTQSGGDSDCGIVFKIATDGTGFEVLKHLTASEGNRPQAGLLLSGSTLYGTTELGGEFDAGVVFRLALGALTPPHLQNCHLSAGQFAFDLYGDSGNTAVIEVSSNLTDWIPLSTNVLGSDPLPWSDPDTANFTKRFYRAVTH